MENLNKLIKPANVGPKPVYEQEKNFDAGYSPSPTTHKFLREEKIAGTWYKVYQGWRQVELKCVLYEFEQVAWGLRCVRSPIVFYPDLKSFHNVPRDQKNPLYIIKWVK